MNTCKNINKIFLPGEIDWPSAAILTLGNRPGDVEYIRKDALLEWARERLDFACALKSEGQKTVCKELIDKIESL